MRWRSGWILLSLIIGSINAQTYEAFPIGSPIARPLPSPQPSPPQHFARGYQPPPRPAHFDPPRSYGRQHHNQNQLSTDATPPQPRWFKPAFRQPSLNLEKNNRDLKTPTNWQMQQLQQQHPQRFKSQMPLSQHRLSSGAPGQMPRFQVGQLDPINNIIIHLYLNSKDRMSHTEIKTPIRGLFGIGTSHGGPGSHSDPIVITKDFDRDTLEFVDGSQSGGSNVIEVKATVSTPNRQLENTVNRAVNQELNRAIPKVMDRMRGSSIEMDNMMRKELEEALVDELAKNLGETIDNTDITEEDLSKLIEEGFNEVTKTETSTAPPIIPTTRSTSRWTSIPTTTTRLVTATTTIPPRTNDWFNSVTSSNQQNNDDDYSIESEDISKTTSQSPPRIVITTTAPPTFVPSVTTTNFYTNSPIGRTYGGEHVRIVPGFRVTETSEPSTTQSTSTTTQKKTTVTSPSTTSQSTTTPTTPPSTSTSTTQSTTTPTPTTQSTTTPTPTTQSTTTPTSTTQWTTTPTSTTQWTTTPTTTQSTTTPTSTQFTTISTTTQSTTTPATTHSTNALPASTTAKTQSTNDQPQTPRIQDLPTQRPETEVSPAVIPHHGVVSLASDEEEEYENQLSPTVTSPIVSVYTTAVHNLPTKPPSSATLQPSTFSPPLVTEDLNSPISTSPFNTVAPLIFSTLYQTTKLTPPPSTTAIQVEPHTQYTEEPFSSSIEWISSTGTTSELLEEEEEETTTTMITKSAEFDSSAESTRKYSKQPTSSEEIQPNVVLQNGQCPTPNELWDRNRSDVLFLIDSSDAFSEQKFQRAIELIGDTVKKFNNFGPDGVQVSLVQYNDEPYLEFSLRKHNCKKHLLDDIADTEYMAGGSQLGKALSKVSQFAFTKKRGDRDDAENVLIIVTDGQSDDRVQQPIKLAKEHNVTVLVISTIEANQNHVNELAGNQGNNQFELDDPSQELSWKLAKRISDVSESSTSQTSSEPSQRLQSVNPTDLEGANVVGQLLPIYNKPEKDEDSTGIIHLECVSDGFKIRITPTPGFRGIAVVKGYQDDARCKSTATSEEEVNMFISNNECGVTQVKSIEPKGLNSSLVLHLLHDKELNTGDDRAYLLQCFIGAPQDSELSTNLDVIRSDLTIAETISLSTLPPTCTYSIRNNSPNGPIITKAAVGQTVYHRWDCDGSNETLNAYGIQIHGCYASDDVERRFAFVDERGCSSDLSLLSDLTYSDESLVAFAASHVFSVHNAESLKFVCKLSLCTRDGDGCEGVTPPTCGSEKKSDLLLTKRQNRNQNSVDEALTSALSTKVGLTSSSSDGVQSLLTWLARDHVFWVVAVAAVAAILAISIISRKTTNSSETATTCSDPTSMSDSQDSGSIRSSEDLSMHSGVVTPNQRLSEFMRNFDRSRYV